MKLVRDETWENWFIYETAEPGLAIVEMKCCGFRFDAGHDDMDAPGHYTCPVCPAPIEDDDSQGPGYRRGLPFIPAQAGIHQFSN